MVGLGRGDGVECILAVWMWEGLTSQTCQKVSTLVLTGQYVCWCMEVELPAWLV